VPTAASKPEETWNPSKAPSSPRKLVKRGESARPVAGAADNHATITAPHAPHARMTHQLTDRGGRPYRKDTDGGALPAVEELSFR
jgi:hypothetical protein